MKLIKILTCLAIALVWFIPASAQALGDSEQLGKSIFMDEALSLNGNQSCGSCHGPSVGWTGPISTINAGGGVYEGSIAGRFGNRKPPSAAYATQSPVFAFHRQRGGLFTGGNFWDGRATGEKLGNPAADQAQGPFLNPAEQALPDNACVVYFVCNAIYPVALEDVYPGSCDISWPLDVEIQCAVPDGFVTLDPADGALVEQAYDNIALSVADYEASSEVNAFTSKFDAYLAGLAELTATESQGMKLFNGKAKCSRCHTSKSKGNDKNMSMGPQTGMSMGPQTGMSMGPQTGMSMGPKNGMSGRRLSSNVPAQSQPPLFTDYSFDNLGVPRNPDNPFYFQDANEDGLGWVDEGLGEFLESRPEYAGMAEEHEGAHKVPTLRNVDLRPNPGFVKAFSHNGYFKSLKGIVHFYNTRDVKPACVDPFTTEADALAQGCWPEPEEPENVNDGELGDLNLTDAQEDAIVDFLKTLSDGHIVP